MTRKHSARGCDHPTYPEYREQVGEDPARVLYHFDPTPRIRGIREPALVRAYLDVETDRDDPRRDVVAMLNRTVVAIPDDVREELWRAHLESVYDDEGGDARVALESLELWYEALAQIRESVQEEVGDTDGMSEKEVYDTIHGWVDREVDEFSRATGTVRSWFESVQDADRPMHLVQDPSLVIGPRSYKDIEAIGRAFGYDTLATEAQTIESAMEGLRTMNRQEGHRYRESLRRQVAAAGESRAAEAATYYVLTNIQDADSPSALDTSPESPVSDAGDGDDEFVDRIEELIELAPTNNSELMEAWGFDSGSNLYTYMSSEMNKCFERNADGLIVPTDAAKRLVEKAG